MRGIKSFILLVLISVGLFAQEFDVRELKSVPNDVSAIRHERKTVNDETAAIVKVITNITGMQFDSRLGVVDLERKDDGYWVWVAPRERNLKLMATGYLPLEVSLPEPARSGVVYQLTVAAKGVGPAASDLVKVTFRLNEGNVYIRMGESAPVEAVSRTPFYNLPRGRHTFRFFKQGFREEEITLDVQQEQVVDVTLQPGQSQTRLALSGWIIIDSEPRGAEVYLNDQRVGSTPYQQSHIAGEFNLRLQYPLYQDHTESFRLSEGGNVSLPVIKMVPRFGYWEVTSNPTGAEVFLDGKLQGKTPLARAPISSSMHEMILRYPMYHDHKQTFLIRDGGAEKFTIDLRPAFGALVVTSEPTGAKVFIDSREVGTTPWRNEQLPSGLYTIRLEKELFSNGNDVAAVKDGEITQRFIAMSQNFGTLQVNAPESDIFINGQRAGRSRHTATLTPGSYKVKAVRERHIDHEQEVFVTLGRTETITLTPQPRQGAISISTTPFEARGAEIYINGQRQQQTTPATIPLLMGRYDITVRKSGYLESTRNVEVTEGKEQAVTFSLQTFAGSMQQQARRYKRAKIAYGLGTLAAASAGGYFTYSAHTLANDYVSTTKNATQTYNRMEDHMLYSYIAFGAAVPLGIMYIVKAVQQNNTQRKIDISAMPVEGGLLFGVRLRIGE